jgi:DNA mismatch endonuclease (patch repair protein)
MKQLPTDPKRSALMKRVRRSDTSAELKVARALRIAKVRYRKNVRSLPGTPDFANKARRWAIFVNGCFWHHHRCARGTTPKRNREFWISKFRANRDRDARKLRALRGRKFKVEIIWECEASAPDRLAACISRIKTGTRESGKS